MHVFLLDRTFLIQETTIKAPEGYRPKRIYEHVQTVLWGSGGLVCWLRDGGDWYERMLTTGGELDSWVLTIYVSALIPGDRQPSPLLTLST